MGSLAQVPEGFFGAFVYKLPILPMMLRGQNLSAGKIAEIVFLYNTIFEALYLTSLFASLMIVAYGVYRLVNER